MQPVPPRPILTAAQIEQRKQIKSWSVVGGLVLLGIASFHYLWDKMGPVLEYKSNQTCGPESFTTTNDHSAETKPYFQIEMKPGCWSGWVTMPTAWPDSHYQPLGEQHGWWIAFWPPTPAERVGPFRSNAQSELSVPPNIFRLQGSGTVVFYTNAAQGTIPTPSSSGANGR